MNQIDRHHAPRQEAPRQEVHRQEAKGRQVQMGHRSAPEEEGHDPFAGPALQEGREEGVGPTHGSVRLRLNMTCAFEL